MDSTKLTLLVFVPNYLPGYKSGGPVRTIANLVEHLGNDYNFLIVTKDRDIQDKNSYPDIIANGWNKIGNTNVFYLSPDKSAFLCIMMIFKNTKFDIVYLNSFFNYRYSILPLLLLKDYFLRIENQ